mgnify:CR=1 FL=1
MSLQKLTNSNMHHYGLNDTLIKLNYSDLANKSFNNLILPPGFIVDKKPIERPIEKKNYINYSKNPYSECISDEVWDNLDKLSEVKPNEDNEDNEVNKDNEVKQNKPNKPNKQNKPTRKKRKIKNKKRKKTKRK